MAGRELVWKNAKESVIEMKLPVDAQVDRANMSYGIPIMQQGAGVS